MGQGVRVISMIVSKGFAMRPSRNLMKSNPHIFFLKNIIFEIKTLSTSLALVKSLTKGLGNFPLLVHNIFYFVEAVNKLRNSRNKALKYQ